jgi:hypothetical protein
MYIYPCTPRLIILPVVNALTRGKVTVGAVANAIYGSACCLAIKLYV